MTIGIFHTKTLSFVKILTEANADHDSSDIWSQFNLRGNWFSEDLHLPIDTVFTLSYYCCTDSRVFLNVYKKLVASALKFQKQ